MIEFRYTEDVSGDEVRMDTSAVTLEQVLERFLRFLSAAGFSFDSGDYLSVINDGDFDDEYFESDSSREVVDNQLAGEGGQSVDKEVADCDHPNILDVRVQSDVTNPPQFAGSVDDSITPEEVVEALFRSDTFVTVSLHTHSTLAAAVRELSDELLTWLPDHVVSNAGSIAAAVEGTKE